MLKKIYDARGFPELAYQVLRHMPTPLACPITRYLANKFKAEALALGHPHRITIFVTNRCNMRCPHCFYAGELGPRGNEMSLENFQSLAKSLKGKARQIVLTGGEPFLRDDLEDICAAFATHTGIESIAIMTNASLPDAILKRVQVILDKTGLLLHFQISIDGPAEYHDSIRGAGSFDLALETIRRLNALRHRAKVGRIVTLMCISKANLPFLEETVRSLRKIEGVQPNFNFLRGTSQIVHGLADYTLLNDFDPPDDSLWLSDEEKREALRILDRELWSATKPNLLSALNRLTMETIVENYSTGVRCMAGDMDIVIYPEGDVSLCEMTKPFANLKDYSCSLSELMKQTYHCHKKRVGPCQCTHDCNVTSMIKTDDVLFPQLFVLPRPESAGGTPGRSVRHPALG